MGLFGKSKKVFKTENESLRAEVERLNSLLTPEHQKMSDLQDVIALYKKDVDALQAKIADKKKELNTIDGRIDVASAMLNQKQKELLSVDDDIAIQEYGLYKPHYQFANSDLYKIELTKIRDAQKQCIKNDTACNGSTNWKVNESATKGKAMIRDMKKLLLRAFNVECDDIVDNIKISNYDRSIERIYKISDQISKLGSIMGISITRNYIELKIEEVKLALDFQQKKQEEKELLKELKEQQREAAKVQREIEEERRKLAKEQSKYKLALSTILSLIEKNGESDDLLEKKEDLEGQLDEIAKAIEDVDYRAANQKAGFVYIISNVGSFGENVYKIGMTRRLNPHERVDELGDASVPFNFDVHALIFSEDAPKLETALHHAFEHRKINRINQRREFFRVSLDEIKAEVRKNFDKTVEWIDIAEAEQYRQSLLIQNRMQKAGE